MRDRVKFFVYAIVWAVVLIVVVRVIDKVLEPKYTYSNSTYPMTSTYDGFYDMDRDSVDVLILEGDSVCASACDGVCEGCDVCRSSVVHELVCADGNLFVVSFRMGCLACPKYQIDVVRYAGCRVLQIHAYLRKCGYCHVRLFAGASRLSVEL